MLAYNLEHICSYSAQLQNPPEIIGPVPEGIRINFTTLGWASIPKMNLTPCSSHRSNSPVKRRLS